jgi:cytochrome c
MNYMQSCALAGVVLIAAHATAEPADAIRGERVYRACAPCHSLDVNRNMTGPSLAEVWNRKSGSLASFSRYSEALKSAGIIWNDDTLVEWVKDPQHFIPGNTMTFPGIKDARQRYDLIAFLKEAAQPGRAPKSAEGGNQMGGMMVGNSQVPNLKKLEAGDRVQSINHCGDT